MKNLVFMRTHYIDDSVRSEYSKLAKIAGDEYKTILFIDNHTKFIRTTNENPFAEIEMNGLKTDCFLFDEKIFESTGLPYYTDYKDNSDIGKIMWYCSDYPIYIMRKFMPDYDYYWSVEADVFCNGDSYEPFFAKHSQSSSDFIAHDYRCFTGSNEEWHWNHFSGWIFGDTDKYGCFFPVVRMSAKAADFLCKRRKEHAEIFKEKCHNPMNRWVFCESFVPTELSNNGFKCEDLKEEHLRYLPVYNLNKERIFENPDFKLYHPVK